MLLDIDWDGDVFLSGADCVVVCRGSRGGRGGAPWQSVFAVYGGVLSVSRVYERVSGIFPGDGKDGYDDLRDGDSDFGADGVHVFAGACDGNCRDCVFVCDWVVCDAVV